MVQEVINEVVRKITCLVRLVKIGKDEDSRRKIWTDAN